MPIFAFVFLVALGVDYTIFLFGRVKEEVRQHGTYEGVHVAVGATGGIIASAGLILAGTFAALLTGDLMLVVELGAVVALGVMFDTLVLVPIFLPAVTTVLGQWMWWPSGTQQGETKSVLAKIATLLGLQ